MDRIRSHAPFRCQEILDGKFAVHFRNRPDTHSYRANHPEIRVEQRDIRLVDPGALRRELGLRPRALGLVTACPPCQSFSTLGRMDAADARNDLISQTERFARAFLPAAVVFEKRARGGPPPALRLAAGAAGPDRVRGLPGLRPVRVRLRRAAGSPSPHRHRAKDARAGCAAGGPARDAARVLRGRAPRRRRRDRPRRTVQRTVANPGSSRCRITCSSSRSSTWTTQPAAVPVTEVRCPDRKR